MTGTYKRISRAAFALSVALIGSSGVPGLVPLTAAVAQPFEDEEPFAQLEQYGDWVNHWRYGRVWYPRDVDADWRPYTRGHWELTDEYGWYWESAEPWGWATYHYGRWALDDDYGWIWIPGDQWGPAWVDWRQNDETVGWAPLPPEVGWSGDGLAFADADLESEHYRPEWCFVPLAHFMDRDFQRHIAPPSRNFMFLDRTQRVTRYEARDHGIFNRSIDPGRLAALTHRDVRPVGVTLSNRPQIGSPGRQPNRPISVFRPEFKGRPQQVPQPGQFAPQVNAPAGQPVPPGAARQYPTLPQGGFHAPAVVSPQGQGNVTRGPQPDPGLARALQQRQAEAARRLQETQARERANAQAARAADMARRHQMEQQELQRIQQQQRAVQMNRQQFKLQQPQRPPQPQAQPQAKFPQPQRAPAQPAQPGGPPR